MTAKVKLGATGPEVLALGLGCSGFSGTYGATHDEESIATIRAALDAGVTLLDTADFYGMGHNELLIGKAIAGRRDEVVLSVKSGSLRGPNGAFLGVDCRPAALKTFAAYSLKRLGVEAIDIYRPARLDPAVPIEETIGAIADLVRGGYVKHIGLSEVGAETVRRAHAVHPIVDLQIEYSIASRTPEERIFPALHELGVGATLYGVLSRGLLGGNVGKRPGDLRAHLPRFSGENKVKNDVVVAALTSFAAARGMTTAQLAIAWARAREPRFVTLVGARNLGQLTSALGALAHPLTKDDLGELERIAPVTAFAGERYTADQMAALDSER